MKKNRFLIKEVKVIIFWGLILVFLPSIYSNAFGGLFDGTMNLGLHYEHFSETEIKQVLGAFSIRRNFTFVSDESPLNEFRFLSSKVGLRFGPENTSEFTGETKIIDLNIFHQSLLLNGTIMNINIADFLEEDIVWFSGKVGFAVLTGNNQSYLSLKILASAGQGRWILGATNYDKMGSFNEKRLLGLEAGYSGGFFLQLNERFFIESNFSNRKIVVDPEPNLVTLQGKISFKLGSNEEKIPQIFVHYLHQKAKISKRDLEQNNSLFSAGISIDFK